MNYIIPNGIIITLFLITLFLIIALFLLALKTFTFAHGSIPRIAWFANTVVSSNSVEAQSIFITVVLICDALIMF